MKNLNRLSWIVAVWCALCGMRAQAQIDPQAEKGDAVFRNLVKFGITVGHTAIYWGYYINGWPDNQFRHTVIEAVGTGSSSSSTVAYCPFDDESYPPTFLSGNTYWGAGNRSGLNPATWDGSANSMSAARRDAIITDSQQLIGTAYCWYNIWDNSAGLDGTVSCEPRSTYPTYPSYIRCDGVVQWVYERVGFNMGDRYTSILDASPYPINRMSRFYAASVDTPSTTLQDNGSTCMITAYDNSSTPTKVNIVYPSGTTGFYSSPATITKQVGTTFYQGVDLAGHAESWKQFSYSPSDITPPAISAFNVSPSTTTLGSGFTVSYTVSDSGGSGLKQVALWRASINGSATDSSWIQVGSAVALSGNGPYSSNFSDTPTAAGNYWYGIHVVDNANNYMDERIAGLGPLQRTVSQITTSAMTSPTLGSVLTSSSVTFQWSSGTGVTNYYLSVGNSLGANDIYGQYVGMNLSTTVSSLPTDGRTLYVRLFWAIPIIGWQSADYTYTAYTTTVQPTRIISLSGNLAFNSVMVGSSAQNTLTIANNGNSAMTVSSISYPSGFSGNWSGTIAAGGSQPVTVTFSPTSATSYGGTVTVNANLTSGVNTITASGTGTQLPVITSPTQGSTLTSSSVTFQWSSGTSVTNYYLSVGNSLGANDIYGQYVGLNLSTTVTSLPTDGRTLYVRLYWATPTVGWQSADYTYTAFKQITPPKFGGSSVSGGALQTTLSGLSSGATVVMQVSSDLKNWNPIKTNIVSGSTLLFTNTINPAMHDQFFRAMVQ